jgi:hypothetical protein
LTETLSSKAKHVNSAAAHLETDNPFLARGLIASLGLTIILAIGFLGYITYSNPVATRPHTFENSLIDKHNLSDLCLSCKPSILIHPIDSTCETWLGVARRMIRNAPLLTPPLGRIFRLTKTFSSLGQAV